jgi:hypothetical protein
VKAKKIGKVLDGSDLLLSHAINPFSLLYLLDYFTQRSFFATTADARHIIIIIGHFFALPKFS